MKKILKALSIIIFSPFILIYLIILFPIKIVEKAKIKKFLYTCDIKKVDALSGFDFETFISCLLDTYGFKTKLTEKSGDKGVDIKAKFNGRKIAIQTKLYYGKSVGVGAIQEIHTAMDFFDCQYSCVITNSKYSASAMEVAEKLNVRLIDRQMLIKLLNKKEHKNNLRILKEMFI